MTQSNTSLSKPKPKKKWLIFFVILGIILLPLVALDIHYRLEFSKYDNEVKRIASYLPPGTTEDTSHPNYQAGNGLWSRFVCEYLSSGVGCPTAERNYLAEFDPDTEMEGGRQVLMKAGYQIDPNDEKGTISGDCTLSKETSCWLDGKNSSYSVRVISWLLDDESVDEGVRVLLRIEPVIYK